MPNPRTTTTISVYAEADVEPNRMNLIGTFTLNLIDNPDEFEQRFQDGLRSVVEGYAERSNG
ncbi:hypothetical protein [Allonocardiopsis opalescens]|uniref:Uncharacterized protein n=1 Tax=Allonocardiopsis opalescens TaxID=1144618 RepID=A0A2T0PSQ7_9ACTN|nr:hypothetical protein [Allonocardiopsis opalescens]PRX91934.1 hypothetical protein CLV72_1127 [Allonocardiopsis opalescens]